LLFFEFLGTLPPGECSPEVISSIMTAIMKIKNMIATNIRKYRKKRRMTQEQAAERAEITSAYWQRLELISQPDLPSIHTIFKIAKALNIHPYQLLK
jgi:DNA-binding XRE family transcriptional regulator